MLSCGTGVHLLQQKDMITKHHCTLHQRHLNTDSTGVPNYPPQSGVHLPSEACTGAIRVSCLSGVQRHSYHIAQLVAHNTTVRSLLPTPSALHVLVFALARTAPTITGGTVFDSPVCNRNCSKRIITDRRQVPCATTAG